MNLHTPISKLPSVGPVYAKRLEKLEIETIKDLIYHVPHRYKDFRIVSKIADVQISETLTIKAKVSSIKNIYTRGGKKIQSAEISDNTGQMKVIWFNQPFLVRNIISGDKYSFSGKVDWFDKKKSLISPDWERLEKDNTTIHTGRLVPVYPETSRLSSKWIRNKIFFAFNLVKGEFEEFLPNLILKKLNYPTLIKAIENIHFPKDIPEADLARERLSFDEILILQISALQRKKEWQKIKVANTLGVDKKTIEKFIRSLDFHLTSSQEIAINEILFDLGKSSPMNRLLEGDVGSGKTVVAAAGAFCAFVNGYQSVFMAPTQILAKQHFDTLRRIFDRFKVRVSLITSEGVQKDLGKTDIFVGTHALIHRKVDFDKIAFVVIDEQHRFGVEQRAHLVKKAGKKRYSPHTLTMTATPIPRTVALTVYKDLDLSTLDELPLGRKPITTWLVPPQKREGAYSWISEKIQKEKTQAYIICPLIEESQVETMKQVKAATHEYEKLQKIFRNLRVGLLHGKQKVSEKNSSLDAFKNGNIDILVATPVVEVGIDVANATIMIIEASERFGLAQLHQLRGRIGRGEKKSYCLLFTESTSLKVLGRLKALKENKSGFELAELDLKLRGPGEIFGTRQHGFPELKIASWSDLATIKKAKSAAEDAIRNPGKYPKLIKLIESQVVLPN